MGDGAKDSRSRIVVGAADMIRRRGLAAMSIRDLAKHAGAPLGSTYHYFPDGKQQLASEAVELTGGFVSRALGARLEAGQAAGVVDFLAYWRTILVDTAFEAGCPVLAVVVDGETDVVRDVAAEVFADWHRQLARSLRKEGVGRSRADRIATLVVAATEGAIVLCRAQRSVKPLDRVAAELDLLISSALAG